MLIYEDKAPFIQNILLIDSTIEHYQEVVDSVNSNTLAIVYDYNCTFEDLSNVFINHYIFRIGIFCHSDAPFFNNKPIYSNVSGMIDFIQHFKIDNIDFLACNTLNIPDYKTFYEKLQYVCIVGASNDKTGNIKYGGDWIMETTGEDIESIYFTKKIEYYTYLLDTPTQTWGQPSALGNATAACGLCFLYGALVLSTNDSFGSLIVYTSTQVVSAGPNGNNRRFYPLRSTSGSINLDYVAYGMTSINLQYNSESFFAITSVKSSATYYISYVKGSYILTSAGAHTTISNGAALFNAPANNSSQNWISISNVDQYSGIVSYGTDTLFVGLTNGNIMRITITDINGGIPTSAQNITWCNTGTNAIRGMVTYKYDLYAINSIGTIFKIDISTSVGIRYTSVSNGTSLAILNDFLYVGVQSTTTPGNGSGNITKINLYNTSISPSIYNSTYYTSTRPANLALCVYSSYLFSTAILTGAGTTIISRFVIDTSPSITTASITPFKFNLNGTMADITSILVNTTNNINNLGKNTNYNSLNNSTLNDIGILFQNSASLTNNTIETNYYILVGGVYRDISNYFTLTSSYTNYRTPTLLTTYDETYIFQRIVRYSDVNTNGYIPLSSYGTGIYKISCIANNTSTAKIYTYNAPITRYRLYLGVLCMGGGGSGSASFAGGGGGYCYSEILLVGGAQYSISVGGIGSATSITYSGNSNTANGGNIGNATGTAGGGSSSVNLGINSFTVTGGNNVTNGIANGNTFYTYLKNNNYTFFTWMNDNAIVGIPNVVCGGGSGGNNSGNAGYNDGNGTSLIGGTSTNAQTTGSIGGGYSNGGGKSGTGGGGIIYLFYNTVQMTPKFNAPPINVTSVTSDHLFYYIMNNNTTVVTNTIVMPFTAYAYIICIGGGGSGSDGIGGGGGGAFVYAEIPLLGGKTYTISVGGPSQATTFTDGISTISAGGSSGTLNGIATNTFTSSNIIQVNGNAGGGINGGLNIIGLSINSDFKNDIKNNSTLTDYDNNIPIGCGAYGNGTDYNGTSVYIDTNGNSQYRIDSTQYSSIYTPDPLNNFTGTGTGNGGGGNGTNSGGGGMIMIYF